MSSATAFSPSELTSVSSADYMKRADALLPGGASSSARAYGDGVRTYWARGAGPYLFDDDGRRSVDCLLGFGCLLFGHAESWT
jgi:glutamate-1-semialdehyde 2,1-aminomutase